MDKVDIMYIKFDDKMLAKKLKQTDNLSRCSSWVPIERTDTRTNFGNSYISASIQ